MRKHVNNPLAFALLGGQLLFLVASWFPIWTLWYFNPREGLGFQETLWSVLWNTVISRPPLDPAFQVTTSGDMRDILQGEIIFAIGVALGFLTYVIRLWAQYQVNHAR